MQQYVDLRQEAMDKLKGENEALMQRLFEVEARLGARGPAAGGSGVGDGDGMDVEETMLVGSGSAGAELVPRKSWETEKEMRQKLEEELKQREKRILRLKEVRSLISVSFYLHFELTFYFDADLPVEEHRVQGLRYFDIRRQACVLSERKRAGDKHVRSQRDLRVPAPRLLENFLWYATAFFDVLSGLRADEVPSLRYRQPAARSPGRAQSRGRDGSHGILARVRAMYAGIHGGDDSAVL